MTSQLTQALTQELNSRAPGSRSRIVNLLKEATESEKLAAWRELHPAQCRAIWDVCREARHG